MKKLLSAILLILLSVTGCSANALDEYKKAVATTMMTEKGVQHMSILLDMEMNTEGLSYEEIKNLSYFDKVEYSADIQYDVTNDKNQVILTTYTNLGGLGLDFKIYINEDQMYMTSPMFSGYMNLSEQRVLGEKEFSGITIDGGQLAPIIEKWNEMLTQEEVLKQEKTYILTDDGQIKTTIYSIHADEEQLKIIMKTVLEMIDEQKLLDEIPFEEFGVDELDLSEIDIQAKAHEFIDRLELKSFDGEAYVDFDGRLVRNNFEVKLGLKEPKKGEPKTIKIVFTNEFDHLGEELEFDFPVVSEDEWIDTTNEELYKNFMPSN